MLIKKINDELSLKLIELNDAKRVVELTNNHTIRCIP